jgi:hypothetical protein
VGNREAEKQRQFRPWSLSKFQGSSDLRRHRSQPFPPSRLQLAAHHSRQHGPQHSLPQHTPTIISVLHTSFRFRRSLANRTLAQVLLTT